MTLKTGKDKILTEEQPTDETTEELDFVDVVNKVEMNTGVSVERLSLATRLVAKTFGVSDDYHVTKFNDKGKVVDIVLENGEFIVAVTIKNSEAQGMCVEQ